MYLNNQNLKDGLHRLVDRNYRAVHLNLNLDLWISPSDQVQELYAESDEMVILILTGSIRVVYGDQTQILSRKNLFDQVGACLLIAPKTPIAITTLERSEVLVIATKNNQLQTHHLYDVNNTDDCFFGANQWDQTALRNVRTYFDYQKQPQSNLVVGEVISYPGRWSSYAPHYHAQPELYFFKFDHPAAFGISIMGENAHLVRENDIAAIESNVTHPVVSAPGYPLYFCWIVRHLEQAPWQDRIVAKEHEWLVQPDANYWKKGKI